MTSIFLLGFSDIQASPGTLVDTQTFATAGAGVWNKPSGATYAEVEMWGGGGSGGDAYNGGSFSQGGEGGYYAKYKIMFNQLNATQNLYVGNGGSGKTGNGGSGYPGEYSWFAEAIWVIGGYGGRGQFTALNPALTYTPTNIITTTLLTSENGGAGGYATEGGSVTYAGGGGGGGSNYYNSYAGGTSTYGGAGGTGAGAYSAISATPGSQSGGGGGGNYWSASTSNSVGAAGKIIIKSYA
jgi:hypothetical protein